MGGFHRQGTADGEALGHGIHRGQGQGLVLVLHHLLDHQVAAPSGYILGGGRRLGTPGPAHHIAILSVLHVLGGIEQLAVQPGGCAVGAVGGLSHGIPEGVVLAGIGQVPGAADLEGVAALQVPERLRRIGEDDAVIGHGLEIGAEGEFQDPGDAALGRRHGQGDRLCLRIVIGLRVAKILLLTQLSRRDDLPALQLFEGGGTVACGYQNLFFIFQRGGVAVTGIEEIIGLPHLDHGPGTDPAVLSAGTGRLQNGRVMLGIGQEIGGGGQIGRVIVGIAAILEIVDIVDAVLIVGHGVAHIGLYAVIQGRAEEGGIVVGLLLAAGRPECREVLVVALDGNFVAGISIPGGIERQVGLDLILLQIPGLGEIRILIPARKHIALPHRVVHRRDLLPGADGLGRDLIAVKTHRVLCKHGAAAHKSKQQADTEKHGDGVSSYTRLHTVPPPAPGEGMASVVLSPGYRSLFTQRFPDRW